MCSSDLAFTPADSPICRDAASGTITWVLLIPGYTSNLRDSLAKAKALEATYRVNVILFSWPADPSGIEPSRYYTARDAATFSSAKLNRLLQHLEQEFATPARQALGEKFRLNLLMHSLGNRVFEKYALSQKAKNAASIGGLFDTIIMHQPDVDSDIAGNWLPIVKPRHNLYLTINKHDAILMISDIVNKTRLGMFPGASLASACPQLSVIDLTGGHFVAGSHWFFTDIDNAIIRLICQRMLAGDIAGADISLGLGHTLVYDHDLHHYVLSAGNQ